MQRNNCHFFAINCENFETFGSHVGSAAHQPTGKYRADRRKSLICYCAVPPACGELVCLPHSDVIHLWALSCVNPQLSRRSSICSQSPGTIYLVFAFAKTSIELPFSRFHPIFSCSLLSVQDCSRVSFWNPVFSVFLLYVSSSLLLWRRFRESTLLFLPFSYRFSWQLFLAFHLWFPLSLSSLISDS